MLDLKERIAQRAAQELRPGDVVNLGIGLPMKVARFLPEGVDVTFESENGFLGIATGAEVTEPQPDLLDAGGHYSAIRPGACFFDSAESFGLIRGGHIDITVLGAMQVDQHGNLANWAVPGKLVVGMGGAMDRGGDIPQGTAKLTGGRAGHLHNDNISQFAHWNTPSFLYPAKGFKRPKPSAFC